MTGPDPSARPMRICSIVTSLTSGGAETLVANLSEEFSAAGHESLVVALCDAETLGNAPGAEERLHHQITAAGGTVQSLGLSAKRPLLSGMRRLRRILGRFHPDVVHAHTARAMTMLLARPSGTPLVLTHHNSVLSFPPALFRLFDRMDTHYVAISREAHGLIDAQALGPITYIPNAAGRGFLVGEARETCGAPARVLTVGAVSDQKNYPLLIAVAKFLRERLPAGKLPVFTIAGNGADLPALRATVMEEGLEEHVRFLGERNDVPDLMAASDLYLNTSRYEGMPVSLLEAMGMALPVIATDVAGNRELVSHETSGLLAASDAAALAGALIRAIDEPNLYSRLSAGAREAGKQYSIGHTAARHLALYTSLGGGRHFASQA